MTLSEKAQISDELWDKINKIHNSIPDELKESKEKMFTIMYRERSNDPKKHDSKKPLDLHYKQTINKKYYLSFVKHPDHLVTYEQAINQLINAQTYPDRDDYFLGMLVKPPYVFLDVDDIGDEIKAHTDGKKDRISSLDKLTNFSYCEISQSGNGLHYIFKGTKTRPYVDRMMGSPYELYDHSRFVTLTGNLRSKLKKCYEVKPKQMADLEQFLWGDPKKQATEPIRQASDRGNGQTVDFLIDKAKHAKNAEKFNHLWSGACMRDADFDHSSSDQALANILIYWTNHDLKTADQMFRLSALYRPEKWDQKHGYDDEGNSLTYGQMTLRKADSAVKDGYKVSVKELINKTYTGFKSNAECVEYLENLRKQRDSILKSENPDKIPPVKADEATRVLRNVMIFKKIYNVDSNEARFEAPLYFWDYDAHCYSLNPKFLRGLILAYAPELVSKKTRDDIVSALSDDMTIPTVPNAELTNEVDRYLSVNNGLVDLVTKKIRPLTPDDFYTYKIATNYYPDLYKKPEPVFKFTDPVTNKHFEMRYLDAIRQNCKVEVDPSNYRTQKAYEEAKQHAKEEEKRNFLQMLQMFKGGVTGFSGGRKMALLLDGTGQLGSHTGKSTAEEAIKYIVGEDLTGKIQLHDLGKRKNLSMILNKKYIYGDDNSAEDLIKDVGVINPLISGDAITVKKLYQEPFSTRFRGFIVQSSNGIPNFENITYATLSRLIPIKFSVQHSETNPAIRAIKSYWIKQPEWREWFLSYLINCVDISHGFVETEETQRLLHQIAVEGNSIDNFVEEWMPKLKSEKVPMKFLYSYYVTASQHDKFKPESYRIFVRKLSDNATFNLNWSKKTMRIKQSVIKRDENDNVIRDENTGYPVRIPGFRYADANMLIQLAGSTRGLTQTFFTTIKETSTTGDEGEKYSTTGVPHADFKEITAYLKDFHAQGIERKNIKPSPDEDDDDED